MLSAFLLSSLEKQALDPVSVTRGRLSACSAPYENYCAQYPQHFLGNAIFPAYIRPCGQDRDKGQRGYWVDPAQTPGRISILGFFLFSSPAAAQAETAAR